MLYSTTFGTGRGKGRVGTVPIIALKEEVGRGKGFEIYLRQCVGFKNFSSQDLGRRVGISPQA